MRAQFAPRVVQGLVESAARRVEAIREDIDRNVVERQRDQHAALMRGQALLDPALQRRQQLALLSLFLRALPGARECAPVLRLQRQLLALPGALPELHPGLEQRELVDP